MIKTIALKANTETEVELTGGCHVSIENRGTGIIYASKSSGITADFDGVIAIDSGNAKVLRNVAQYKKENSSYDYYGKIYLLSDADTKAEIQTANDLNFFSRKNIAKGGETIDAYTKSETDNLLADKANTSDLTDYVKNTDYATASKPGIIKVNSAYGTGMSNNILQIVSATEGDIDIGSNDWKPITPYKLPKVMKKYGINSETQIAEMQSDIANKVDNDIFVAENLIKYPYEQQFSSHTGANLSYDDGTITIKGKNTEIITMNLMTHFKLQDGIYTFSNNSTSSKLGLRFYGYDTNGNSVVLKTIYGSNSHTYDTTNDGYSEYSLNLRILSDDTEFVNDTCKPMFEIGSIAHRYQPYSLSRKAMRDDINTIMALLS